ncbi:hypothetical protein B6S12_05305 [Helicobacter valdiviensis]|uniref:Uncharacterized protein n=1 Tax=Helicobacter valdiviensis TaxID=1458358 RepID=A0A2W6MW13_9HELI|nr:hypothetical protein [Helicobacter valdiviensis]PZT48139.1 hypothetical protein B6S12_05305 [Helicobacter valdiviensis]
MDKENINNFKDFKRRIILMMEFLKQYLGVISAGIIFISFALGVWILIQYFLFTINFRPDFSKDLIITNIFLTAWIGIVFVPFFIIFYIAPLFFFKEILKNISKLENWRSVCFIFLPAILSSIGVFLIIYFLDDIANNFPNLKSFIYIMASILPFVVASLFLFGIKKFFIKEFGSSVVLFFVNLYILFCGFCFIVLFFKIQDIFNLIFAYILYYAVAFVLFFIIHKKYTLLFATIFAFILAVIMLNPYIVRVSKIGNYNQSFMLYNKTEVKELLGLYHIPIFKENNATLIVKDLHILSNIGESYLIKNDKNDTFSLDKKSIFSILNAKNLNKIE